MKLAIEQARRGIGFTAPNPVVGAVLVKKGRLVAKSFHKKAGGPHAEVNVIKLAGKKAEGADLYVTLEPCSGKDKRTPPCADLIIKKGIKRVYSAIKDPSVNGFEILRKHNISVFTGLLENESKEINLPFFKSLIEKLPFVTVKSAVSMDGKIAAKTGDSKWISSIESRKYGHLLRKEADAVLTGINTVIKDDPLFTVRHVKSAKDIIRVIVDTNCRLPLESNIVRKRPELTLVAVGKDIAKTKIKRLKDLGLEVLEVDRDNSGKINLKKLLKILSARGINNILCESGGSLTASLFKNKLVDRIVFFISPMIIGGKDAPTAVEGNGVKKIDSAVKIENTKMKKSGGDFMITGDVNTEWRNF